MTKKEIYQKNKENKNRKNPLSVIKDIKISTAISEHDLDIKVDNIRKIFQKRNQVKVLIMPKLKNYQMEVEELRLNEEEKQKDLLKSICEDLEGAGTMVGKETWIGKNVVALFKPLSITQK
jgi:translation initiation factor IF-3